MENGGFAFDDNDNALAYIISPNKVVNGVARYTVDADLLALEHTLWKLKTHGINPN